MTIQLILLKDMMSTHTNASYYIKLLLGPELYKK